MVHAHLQEPHLPALSPPGARSSSGGAGLPPNHWHCSGGALGRPWRAVLLGQLPGRCHRCARREGGECWASAARGATAPGMGVAGERAEALFRLDCRQGGRPLWKACWLLPRDAGLPERCEGLGCSRLLQWCFRVWHCLRAFLAHVVRAAGERAPIPPRHPSPWRDLLTHHGAQVGQHAARWSSVRSSVRSRHVSPCVARVFVLCRFSQD